MNKPIFLSFLLILILCISQVSGMTVIGSRFSGNLKPGDTAVYSMTLKSDTLAEKNVPLTVSMDAGNCSEWIKTDTNTFQLTPAGIPVKASVNVPKDAYNGFYQCRVGFTAPSQGMITSKIEVPVSLTITGGKDAPIPTFVSTTTATPAITPEITLKAPVEEQIIPIAVPGIASVKPVSGPAPEFPIYGVFVAVLIGVFGIVLVYDHLRGRKR